MSTPANNGSVNRDPGFLRRTWAMVVKEFMQMRRDRMTFASMMLVPILQLTLFGYAINTDPKHLPTAVLVRDEGPLTRAVLAAFKNTDYFDFRWQVRDPAELDKLIRSGEAEAFLAKQAAWFRPTLRRSACRRRRSSCTGRGRCGGRGRSSTPSGDRR